MPLWDKDTPPNWRKKIGKKEAVATERGWEDPDTGEVLVAIGNLATKAGEANVLSVEFGASDLDQGDPISVIVTFNERVDVTVGASIEVSSTGLGGNFTLNAAAQTNVTQVVFDKQGDNTTQEVVPSETADLSIAAQSVSGTITDNIGGAASDLAIDADQASAAGVINVA